MPRKGGPGRPSKGDRDQFVVRTSRTLGEQVRHGADSAGLTLSDYIALLLAQAHGMPEEAPLRPINGQEVLPLGKTA